MLWTFNPVYSSSFGQCVIICFLAQLDEDKFHWYVRRVKLQILLIIKIKTY